MRVVLAAAAASVALVGVATVAHAAAPAGFASSPRLQTAAAYVAYKPIAVWCAKTQYDWEQYLEDGGLAGDLNGATKPGSAETSLSPAVCTNLRRALDRRTVAVSALGPSILVLVHEAIHARGEVDEGKTDCAAVHEMPRVAVKFFHVKAGKQLRAVMAASWTYRAREPAAYRTVC